MVTAILLVRTRARAAAREAAARDEIAELAAEVDRLTGLLLTEPQVLVSWPPNGDAPDVVGDVATIAGDDDPATSVRVPAPGSRSPTTNGQQPSGQRGPSAKGLRGLCWITTAGRRTRPKGSPSRGGARRDGGSCATPAAPSAGLSRLRHAYETLRGVLDALRMLIEALLAAGGLRDSAGRFAFVNAAYARAVDMTLYQSTPPERRAARAWPGDRAAREGELGAPTAAAATSACRR